MKSSLIPNKKKKKVKKRSVIFGKENLSFSIYLHKNKKIVDDEEV